MQGFLVEIPVRPFHKLRDKARRVEGRRGFKDDANLVAVGIEGGDVVRIGFVLPPWHSSFEE